MDSASTQHFEDLGRAAEIDSFGIEAGVILMDRFCALSAVERDAHGWWVPVTDLNRSLGAAPHHRMRLELLRTDEEQERKLRRAVGIAPQVQARVHAWLQNPEGVLLLTEPISQPPIQVPLTRDESLTVATALSSVLSLLHNGGVIGVSFAPEAIHLVGHDVRVAHYDHVLARGTAEEDVQRLVELLEFLSGGALSDRLTPRPITASELWDRVRGLHDGLRGSPNVLPSTPPFVGRQDVLAHLMEAARRAKQGRGQIVVVQGASGVGKTRLLRRLAIEVERWMDAVVLSGTFQDASSTRGGFVEVLDELAHQPGSLAMDELRAIRQRIRQRTGPLLGFLGQMSPALRTWLDADEPPPDLHLDERFGQHAATLASALRSVGTRDRPLVVMLDDGHLAEPGGRAILDELRHGPPDHHTLVVVTCDADRPEKCPVDHVESLAIEPLEQRELQELIERALPGPVGEPERDADRLWRSTRGRPIAAWATLKGWIQQGMYVEDSVSRAWQLHLDQIDPTRVFDVYSGLWESMRPHQQWILVVAALRAGRTTIDWLQQVTGWNEAEIRNAAQTVIETGMLVEEPDGGLRFPNNSARQVVEQLVDDEVRANAHRQIADWLDNQPGASASQRAWHQEQARPSGRDEALAIMHLRGGQELLAIYDLARARWHFDKALDRGNSPPIWVDGLAGRGAVALLEGRPHEAYEDYVAAMQTSGDALCALEITGQAAHGFYRKGSSELAYRLASEALNLAGEPLPTSRLGQGLSMLLAVVWLVIPVNRRSTRIRNALCSVYETLIAITPSERPLIAVLSILRGYRHARGLDSAHAASITTFYATFRGSLGHWRTAQRLLDEADATADRAEDPWGKGAVAHMRGQNLLARGAYDQAQQSLDRAVDYFRQSGDMSVAVLSYFLRTTYSRDRYPMATVLEWIQEAVAIARRQGNELGMIALAALEAYLSSRRPGTRDPTPVRELSQHMLARDALGPEAINAHSYAALALVEQGDVHLALEHTTRGTELLRASPNELDVFMDAYIASAAVLTALEDRTREQERQLARALRRLRSKSDPSKRLIAAHDYYRACWELQRGNRDRAIALLNQVVEGTSFHQQLYYAYCAHRLLEELRRPTDVALATRHHETAQEIGIFLGLFAGDSEAGATNPKPPSAPMPGLAVTEDRPAEELPLVDVASLIRRLRPSFESALPPDVPLQIEVAEGSTLRCNKESLQLLIVNLVLAARDALENRGELFLDVRTVDLDPTESARIPGINADAHLLIESRAVGFHGADTISGLGMCCEITTSIGGFVDVRQEDNEVLILGAYLATQVEDAAVTPTWQAPTAEAVVLHSDAHVRQTVVSALRDLRILAEGLDPSLQLNRFASGKLVFAEASLLDRLPGVEAHDVVVLHRRGEEPPPGHAAVRVPFTMGQLMELVESLTPLEAGSSDTG